MLIPNSIAISISVHTYLQSYQCVFIRVSLWLFWEKMLTACLWYVQMLLVGGTRYFARGMELGMHRDPSDRLFILIQVQWMSSLHPQSRFSLSLVGWPIFLELFPCPFCSILHISHFAQVPPLPSPAHYYLVTVIPKQIRCILSKHSEIDINLKFFIMNILLLLIPWHGIQSACLLLLNVLTFCILSGIC